MNAIACRLAVVAGIAAAVAAAPVTRPSAPSRAGAIHSAGARAIGEVAFLPDRDELQPGVRYGFGTGPFSVGITPGAAVFAQRSAMSSAEDPRFATFRMDVVGAAAAATLRGESPCAWRTNVYHGDDPSAWREGVPNYARVRSRGVLPGVDVVYRAEGRRVAFDFEVAPGADPTRIAVAFAVGDDRAPGVRVDPDGSLVVTSGEESMRFGAPVVYQDAADGRTPVPGGYSLRPAADGRTDVAFEVGAYDRSRLLVIDPPSLGSSAYLGGAGNDNAISVALGKSGQLYLLGLTTAPFFAVNNHLGGTTGGGYDGFVAQIDDDNAVVANAVFGGSGTDFANAFTVAADSGDLFVAGLSIPVSGPGAVAFPVTPGGVYAGPGGTSSKGFVVRMTPALSLVASSAATFEQGMNYHGVSVANGHVALACETPSRNLPTTPQSAYPAFPVAAFGPVGAALVLSDDLTTVQSATYAGEANGRAYDCIWKDNGNLVVVGLTTGATLPVVNAPQATSGGGTDGWWAEYNGSLTTVQVSTYVGGAGFDLLTHLAKPTDDPAFASFAGDVFACGACSAAPSLALTSGTYHGGNDILVCAIRPNAAPLVTCIGGGGNELPTAMIFLDQGFVTLSYTDSFGDYTLIPELGPGGGASDACLNAFDVSGTSLARNADLDAFRWGGPEGDPSGGLVFRPLTGKATDGEVIATNTRSGGPSGGDDNEVKRFDRRGCTDPPKPVDPKISKLTPVKGSTGSFSGKVTWTCAEPDSDTLEEFEIVDDGETKATVPFVPGRVVYTAPVTLKQVPEMLEHLIKVVALTKDDCSSQSSFRVAVSDLVVAKAAQKKGIFSVFLKKAPALGISLPFAGTATVAANGAAPGPVGGTASGLTVTAPPGKAPKPKTLFDVTGSVTIPAGSKVGTLTFSNAGLTYPVTFKLKISLNGKSKSVKFTVKPPKPV